VTLIASALYYKSHSGPIHLVTDSAGQAYFKRLQLLPLYDMVINLVVPEDINPKIFWAAGKIYANAQLDTPFVSVDMDAILWQPIHRVIGDVSAVALHTEPSEWSAYKKTWKDLPGPWLEVDLSKVTPVNAGVVAFLDNSFRDEYVQSAIRFMKAHTAKNAPINTLVWDGPSYIDEMVFAEQMMLGIVAQKSGHTIRTIGSYDRFTDHMVPNKKVSHLWNSKRHYKKYPKAREAFMQQMISTILRDFPAARKYIAACGIADVAIMDPNSGTIRYGHMNEPILPGEEREYL